MTALAPHRPAARLTAAAALGLVLAAGQAPLELWWLALPALHGLFRLIAAAPGPRAAALTGWIGGAGYFAGAMFWIVEPFLVEPEVHGWMAPFALLFMAFGMALFWALAAAAGHVSGHGPGGGRIRPATLALAFTAAELLRGYVLTGFPWALIGHIWIGTPVAQLAAFVGPNGLTLLTAALAALPLVWPRAGWPLAAALLAAAWGAGAARLAAPDPVRATPIGLRIVQPNATQRLKWDPQMMRQFLQRQMDLTAAPGTPDLTLWPETAIPWLIDDVPDVLAMISQAAGGRSVVLGAQRMVGPRFYNSLVVLDGQGRPADVYDKHHLVPFGEYFPGGDLAARFGLHGFAQREGDAYSPGPGPHLVAVPGGRALPLICYEAVFPQDLRGTERPDYLIQVTNDGWFGTLSGPYQHLAQARLRAVEQGLPLLRAANTGVSAVIDAKGRVLASLPLDEAGAIDALLPAALPPTPYARTGDGPLALLLALALALAGPGRFAIDRARRGA